MLRFQYRLLTCFTIILLFGIVWFSLISISRWGWGGTWTSGLFDWTFFFHLIFLFLGAGRRTVILPLLSHGSTTTTTTTTTAFGGRLLHFHATFAGRWCHSVAFTRWLHLHLNLTFFIFFFIVEWFNAWRMTTLVFLGRVLCLLLLGLFTWLLLLLLLFVGWLHSPWSTPAALLHRFRFWSKGISRLATWWTIHKSYMRLATCWLNIF